MSAEPAPPSDAEVRMARFAARELGRDVAPEFSEFSDSTGRRWLDVLTVRDVPRPGHVSVSTLSMHRWVNLVGSGADRHDERVELVTVLTGVDAADAAALLVASAFTAVAEAWPVQAGTVFPGVAGELFGTPAEHLLLTAPGLFPRLARYRLDEAVQVRWLQAVPIHEAERAFLDERGLEALEDRFAAAEIAVADPARPPVGLG
ncbi:suppressor of fused domain protein [Paenibacillus sp. TRM 82003]|uniref:suppressor of fused domain protein n=1 Tax=Kineococcus sp. TRM81007 TaxID=2925831 RepID=UPI001F5856AC|nr:suppressor of fused domain protein [Kineococcus sp. TRM81007]MCI2239907.1 suppressor of fused domain protein [Kineococcus sp. TRM81007]MCI3925789.1 suppressor of fused domain protein [Paenibacillus sp. TRM 82003]